MAQRGVYKVYVGRTDEGRAAVAGRSPYFFFVADTEEEALQIAQRALAFYFEKPGDFGPSRPIKSQPSLSRFRKTRIEEISVPG